MDEGAALPRGRQSVGTSGLPDLVPRIGQPDEPVDEMSTIDLFMLEPCEKFGMPNTEHLIPNAER